MLSNHISGQTQPSQDERLVPVHYSDVVKWESVVLIGELHSQFQIYSKQISDEVNLAVRMCKKEVKRSQQLKLEIQII